MRKKDLLELKRRFKKEECTFTRICGCYVNTQKHPILKFRETFLNLDEDEFFKYLEIAKKVLSGTIGNNILELNFPTDENLSNEKQVSLLKLKASQLKDDALLDDFYKSIMDHYDCTDNFLILLFHDVYDVITKTTDNMKLDESEEVYEYVLCAICPVSLSEPGLGYFYEENKIKARIRDWVVGPPAHGFVFPAFIDRSPDINSIMYYSKNPKNPSPELMENALGCYPKRTAVIQKETFQAIIKSSFNDEDKAEKIFMEVQENLNTMIAEYNSIYEDTDTDPILLTEENIQNILTESGLSEEVTSKIKQTYMKNFGHDLPVAENLIDPKVLKANEQRKKEEHLVKEVEILRARLDEIKQETTAADAISLSIEEDGDEVLEEDSKDNKTTNDYDIMIQIRPEKISEIRSQIIEGQKYILIPMDEDEQAAVNGLDDII